MKAQMLGLCRGDGLIYVKVSLVGTESETGISVVAATDDGCPLPSEWFALNDADDATDSVFIAVVIPLLMKGTVVLRIGDGDFGNKAQCFRISMKRAKWSSRFTYQLKRKTAIEIRDIEQRYSFQRIDVLFDYVLPEKDGFLLRGRLVSPFQQSTKTCFEVLDTEGRPANVRPTVVSDYSIPSSIDASTKYREQQFSLRFPDGSRGLTLIAHDEANPDLRGFRSIGPEFFGYLLECGAYFWRSAGADPAYHEWFLEERVDQGTLELQRGVSFEQAPQFSIVVPLYNTPVKLFDDMLKSVLTQSYAQWELVLVNASPDNAELDIAVREAAKQDPRIRFTVLSENHGITENTNYGIAASTGDFVCFLDHDDTLEPDCLFEYARAIDQFPETDLLYCDEDKVDEAGRHYFNPFFKTDFDIDLLRSHNYVCHFLCVRKTALDAIAPPGAAFDGAQDHNLTLRVAERARHIHHIPRVLYHWRVTANSTASADAGERGVKDYANDAGHRAIAGHLERLGIPAQVEPGPVPFSHHVKYLVQNNPLVSIIIPNKDCSAMLTKCIDSIIANTRYEHFEIIIVENNSVEPETNACYKSLEKRDSRVSVVEWTGEFNFSKIINFGAEAAQGDYLLLLNNDTEIIAPEWLENMLGACQREDVGIVGAKLLYPDSTIQHVGVIAGRYMPAHHAFLGLPASDWGYFGRAILMHQCSAVTAACMLTKRSVFEQVGGFEEGLAIAYNDIDYCFKVRDVGLSVVYEPTAQLIHYESVSRGLDRVTHDKRIRNKSEGALLMARWAQLYVDGDPFFNPNIETPFFRLKKHGDESCNW